MTRQTGLKKNTFIVRQGKAFLGSLFTMSSQLRIRRKDPISSFNSLQLRCLLNYSRRKKLGLVESLVGGRVAGKIRYSQL